MTDYQQPLSPEIIQKVNKLAEKYAVMGQDLNSYLEGLLYADYLTYWDYIHLDVLLNLQNPRTPIKDESIFIMYHQITELHFKLILHAMSQIADDDNLSRAQLHEQVRRINTYFSSLIKSFEIMIEGMAQDQFLRFRMALLPASGFQSVQYRMIEICATDLDNLVASQHRESLSGNKADIAQKYQHLYWKQGAVELATGKKTLTLKQFEQKYSEDLIRLAKKYQEKNIWQRYNDLPKADRNNEDLIEQLRELDLNANVRWPLMHYKSAVRYLQRDPQDIAATGGTNWQKYLPPKNQYILFFPSIWTAEERENWGKSMQDQLLQSLRPKNT